MLIFAIADLKHIRELQNVRRAPESERTETKQSEQTKLWLFTIYLEKPVGRRNTMGAYHLARKSANFGLKSNGKVAEIPSGNSGVPSEVLLFFRSERNGC